MASTIEIPEKMKRSVKAQRVLAGFSQQEVADKMGVDRGTFIRWETNPENIKLGTLYKLSLLYGCKLADFSD